MCACVHMCVRTCAAARRERLLKGTKHAPVHVTTCCACSVKPGRGEASGGPRGARGGCHPPPSSARQPAEQQQTQTPALP
jgi:hypothetical protein